MRLPRAFGALGVVALAAALAIPPGAPQATDAASHREAPLISLDPAADITDFFMFRSYEAGNPDKVVLVMNVIPGEEPSSGPNYFLFDPNVRYAFNIDNDMDGVADDVAVEVQFSTEIRGIVDQFNLFLGYVGGADGLPPITALDGPGSEGLGLRQHYTVTMVRKGERKVLGSGLIAVPSRVGPRTMPSYDALAAQGIYDLGGGVRVFAGQREDPFYIDLAAIFDTLINEAVTGTEDKDEWNARDPEQESRFLDYYLNPRLALAMQLVFGVPAATSNRTDLRDLLLKYQAGDERLSELLRIDLRVPPTPFAAQRRMGPLAGPADPAAWPNGRRPKDDVTDIAIRVVGGPNYIAARPSERLNANDAALSDHFPFLASPHDGRNRNHANP